MNTNTSSTHIPAARRDQRGVVSITVTMIVMVVLSLLVIGFAQVSRRNQRQAVDQQLSTQAFYAAESGINAARNAIKLAGVGAAIPAKTGCGPETGFFAALDGNVKADSGVSYSCLLVNPAPGTLTFNEGTIDDRSTVIPINAATGNLTSIKLVWYPKDANALDECPTTSTKAFVESSDWKCGYGVLRFDLVPITASMRTDVMSAATMTTFAVPTKNGNNTMTYAGGSGNDTKDVKCSDDHCELNINIPSPSASMYMRIRSLYRPTEKLEISGKTASGSVGLTGAQALIDSTGKAQDVLRRVQVRVPISGSNRNQSSDYAIQTRDSLCKRFAVMTGYFSSNVPDAFANGTNGGNPLCKTLSVADPTGPADGSADISDCRSGCPSAGSAAADHDKTWNRHFTNKSTNAARVTGCLWTFGYAGAEIRNEACNYGDVVSWDYPEINRCINYTVTLTVYLEGGGTGHKVTDTYVPHGDGTTAC